MKPYIKICGVTNDQDLKELIKLDIDAIGFNRDKDSPRYVSFEFLESSGKCFNEKISPLLVYEQGKTKLYLGFDNFRVITKYNRSSKYALAVHQLALEISKRFDD